MELMVIIYTCALPGMTYQDIWREKGQLGGLNVGLTYELKLQK